MNKKRSAASSTSKTNISQVKCQITLSLIIHFILNFFYETLIYNGIGLGPYGMLQYR